MKKVIIRALVIIAFLVGWFFFFIKYIYNEKQVDEGGPETTEVSKIYDDLGYVYFGNEATGDLDADGIEDVAFIVTQNGGGSGTFYYVGAAFKNSDDSYTRTNLVLLGDRIAPQTTEIRDKTIIVNYADRKEGEPMTARPSVGISKYLQTFNGILIPLAK